MFDNVMSIAECCGIADKVSKLIDAINTVQGVSEVEINVDGYLDAIYEVILVVGYSDEYLNQQENYYKAKEKFRKDVLQKCRRLGLKRTQDRIEDYGTSFYIVFDSSDWNKDREVPIKATCSLCGESETYVLKGEEVTTFEKYQEKGREMGYLQDLFPKVPNWIRSGVIDQYSGGFCICPKCSGF